MPFGDNMVWADPINPVGEGQKRHAYRDGDVTMYRRCGTTIGGNFSASRSALMRMEAQDYALLTNACLSCVDAMDLTRYREQNISAGSGAEAVEYDPFGVFSSENDQ